jgi:hypothetical protein
LYSSYLDWQKAFYHAEWTKLMQILKETGTDWHKGRLNGKLFMDQSIKVKLDQGETKSMKIGRRVTHSLPLIGKDLTNETLQGFGNCKVGGQVICTVKYAGDLVLLTKEETVLQDMIDRLTGIGR